MNLKEIYELWDRFEASRTSELELDMQGVHLVLKKAAVAEAAVPVVWQTAPEVITEPVVAESVVASQQKANTVTIKAPLMGTFYRAAAPGEAPFVSVGDEVHKGDVVGIIEAMKLMNEITAPTDGVITEILAEDGSIVEFGQVLMELR